MRDFADDVVHGSPSAGEALRPALVKPGAEALLTEMPKGAKKPLHAGVYVDTAGTKPSKPCFVGFSLQGKNPLPAG